MNKIFDSTPLQSALLNEQCYQLLGLHQSKQSNHIDIATLIHLYETMVLCNMLDQKAINMHRTGQLNTYPAATGQEAIGAAIGHALNDSDIFIPYYRDQAVFIQRNIKIEEWFALWGGHESANQFQNNPHDFPVCVPIATQCLHAVGIAKAIQIQNKKIAALVCCGDGATSKGDFYEALNAAGVWKLPLVFVVNNNQWAISVPLHKQTACSTIADKAKAAGMPGLSVDGNDPIALYHAMLYALNRAYTQQGPMLIEAISYRLCDHTTVDNASRYRSDDELNMAKRLEPIARTRNYLHQHNHWNEDKEHQWRETCKSKIEEATKNYLDIKACPESDCFDFLYAQLPEHLDRQKKDFCQQNRDTLSKEGNHHD